MSDHGPNPPDATSPPDAALPSPDREGGVEVRLLAEVRGSSEGGESLAHSHRPSMAQESRP